MDFFKYTGKGIVLMLDHYSDFHTSRQPDHVISDNGLQFADEQFRTFTMEWEFEYLTSFPWHPKANGKAESAVQIVKSPCNKATCDVNDPWKAILQWRNTPTEDIDRSPAQPLMSRRLMTPCPVAKKLIKPRHTSCLGETASEKKADIQAHL